MIFFFLLFHVVLIFVWICFYRERARVLLFIFFLVDEAGRQAGRQAEAADRQAGRQAEAADRTQCSVLLN